MTRVLIAAAGDGSRWRNHRGTSKHLAVVDSDVLLHRTCRQFLRYTSDVTVVGAHSGYAVPDTALFVPPPSDASWLDLGKFLSSRHLWATAERTVLVFGDVYFTDDAVDKIMASTQDWMFFLRPGPSSLMQARREVFGLAFDPSAHELLDQRLGTLLKHRVAPSQGGWRLYADMVRPSYGDIFRNDRHVVIDDLTTDLDYPKDIEVLELALLENRP